MIADTTNHAVAVQTLIPNQLMTEAQEMVSGGLYRNFDELLLDATRSTLYVRSSFLQSIIAQVQAQS